MLDESLATTRISLSGQRPRSSSTQTCSALTPFGNRGVWNEVCFLFGHGQHKTAQELAGRKLARRLTRSIPYIGALIAVATLGSAIRRKGLIRGVLHSGLDAIPYVGGAKNLAEAARGRDFRRDRVSPRSLQGDGQ